MLARFAPKEQLLELQPPRVGDLTEAATQVLFRIYAYDVQKNVGMYAHVSMEARANFVRVGLSVDLPPSFSIESLCTTCTHTVAHASFLEDVKTQTASSLRAVDCDYCFWLTPLITALMEIPPLWPEDTFKGQSTTGRRLWVPLDP